MTKQLLQKFATYFLISCGIYFFFLLVEALSLYFNDMGFDLKNSFLVSFRSIVSVINFGLTIAFTLITIDFLKEKYSMSRLYVIGLTFSIVFGSMNYFFSNYLIPDTIANSYLNRYENIINRVLDPSERAERKLDFKSSKPEMMSNSLIKVFSDSISNEITKVDKVIAEVVQRIPDSILESNFSNKDLSKYNSSKNKITNYQKNDNQVLSLNIRKREALDKQLNSANWESNKRYFVFILTLFCIFFGIVIGVNFNNQKTFSLVCIAIVFYTLTLSIITSLKDYIVDGNNLIGLVFKFTLVFGSFLYFLKKSISKYTGANNVYSS